jgi:4-hydroxy-4-methyl-2-oxoglutarate aldolase
MQNQQLFNAFQPLSTPLIADACVRLDVPLRVAPPGIMPIIPTMRVAGRVLPAQHYGSVDIFLEALHQAQPGDVLVIDDGGRDIHGCIGDLTVLEAQAYGLAGIIVWGRHRDTNELVEIAFPVFSYGAYAPGPIQLWDRPPDALTLAHVGMHAVTGEDAVFADRDGALFVRMALLETVLQAAMAIHGTERQQVARIRQGERLSDQFQFANYLVQRQQNPAYTFREHLRAIGGAIEE